MSARPPHTTSVPAPTHQLDVLLAEAATHAADTPEGRDAKGRFAKGNPGGPGNPFARHVARLRSALVQCVGEEDIRHIAKGLLSNARIGHLPSVRILLMYVLGKPSGAVNPDTLDIDEWRQLVQPLAQIAAELPQALLTVPAATATDMVRTAQPYAQRMAGEEMTAPPLEEEEEAREEEARRQRGEAQPGRKGARTRPQPSPNGVFGPRGAVPRWLHQIAAQARMAALRWPKRCPGTG
jgi:hypothetical protein